LAGVGLQETEIGGGLWAFEAWERTFVQLGLGRVMDGSVFGIQSADPYLVKLRLGLALVN